MGYKRVVEVGPAMWFRKRKSPEHLTMRDPYSTPGHKGGLAGPGWGQPCAAMHVLGCAVVQRWPGLPYAEGRPAMRVMAAGSSLVGQALVQGPACAGWTTVRVKEGPSELLTQAVRRRRTPSEPKATSPSAIVDKVEASGTTDMVAWV